MRYVVARYHETRRDIAYRIYVTDALKAIVEIAGGMSGGRVDIKSFKDIIYPRRSADTRTGDEIAEDVISRLTSQKR